MYGKFFASTFTGSMFGAGPNVFAVWSYAIAHTVAGSVELNPLMLSATIGMPPEDVERAIQVLSSPDPRSRSQEEEGRRLVHEGGFQYRVVNHAKYRAIRNDEERREYNRLAKRREREKKAVAHPVKSVNDKHRKSTKSAHTETEAETEAPRSSSDVVKASVSTDTGLGSCTVAAERGTRTLAQIESDVPPGGPSIAWADLCQQIWENRRGGENRFIFDLAPAFRKYGLERLVKGWTAYLDSFPPGAKFVGSAQDFASKAGVWCEEKPAQPVSLAAEARKILARDGMILRSEP